MLTGSYFFSYLFQNKIMRVVSCFFLLFFSLKIQAQSLPFVPEKLQNMDFFKTNGKTNWRVVGEVAADLSQNGVLQSQVGTGVLVNLPDKDNKANLLTQMEHGDVDVSFDFMMAKNSNSGFYLQGRYEIQLLDSWGVQNPTTGDCGGIYKRRKLPEYIMYEGHAPRQNACLAPGLWQHMEIAFQAPKFDPAGKKTANARILKVVLNGIVIHENVSLSGPTCGPISEAEAATGPIMIQGDHGAVAFRNLQFKNYDKSAATVQGHQYELYSGDFKALAKIPTDWNKVKLEKKGTASAITWEVSPTPNNMAIKINSTLQAPTSGDYVLTLAHSGAGRLRIDNQDVVAEAWGMASGSRQGKVSLTAGPHTMEVVISKVDGWLKPGLGVWIEGPGFRQTELHAISSMLAAPPTDPILVKADAREAVLMRSFIDKTENGKNIKRLTHAINVGTPDNLHFSYDLQTGALVQIWKGLFLNTTPMWDNRGDGSSKPLGAKIWLETKPVVALGNGSAAVLDSLTDEVAFRALGYDVDGRNMPTFRYQIHSATVEDAIRPEENGKYFSRTIEVKNQNNRDMVALLAQDKQIEQIGADLFMVGDKKYFLKIMDTPEVPATLVKTPTGDTQLLLPIKSKKIKYAFWW
jgi:hypothetical protein